METPYIISSRKCFLGTGENEHWILANGVEALAIKKINHTEVWVEASIPSSIQCLFENIVVKVEGGIDGYCFSIATADLKDFMYQLNEMIKSEIWR